MRTTDIMTIYFAILHKDRDSAVGVVFPDLPGCFAAGENFDDAIDKAHVALADYALALNEKGRALPAARSFESLFADPDVRAEARDAPMVGVALHTEAQNRRTAGKKAASAAAKALRDKGATKDARRVAASALTQKHNESKSKSKGKKSA